MVLFALNFLCGVASGFTLTLLLALLRLLRRPAAPPPAAWPPLCILRPCEGPDPLLADNLLSSVRAPYPGPRRVLVLVPRETDPAYPAALAAAQEGGPEVEVLITRIDEDPQVRNRKVAQLAVGLARPGRSGELVVQADSDVLLGERDLEELVAALLADERNGAAFAWPVEVRPQTAADRASAALCGASAQNFLALHALFALLGGVPSLAGALCAFRGEALRRSGGLDGLGDTLGEDDAVARRLVRAGYRVAVSPSPARCTDGGRRLREVVERAGRWMTVVRAQRPALLLAYPLTVAATPLHLALSLTLRDPTYLAMAGGLLLLRAALAAVLLRRQGAPARRAVLDVLRAELLMWAGLLRALATRRVRWRGRSYRVLRGGVLQPER